MLNENNIKMIKERIFNEIKLTTVVHRELVMDDLIFSNIGLSDDLNVAIVAVELSSASFSDIIKNCVIYILPNDPENKNIDSIMVLNHDIGPLSLVDLKPSNSGNSFFITFMMASVRHLIKYTKIDAELKCRYHFEIAAGNPNNILHSQSDLPEGELSFAERDAVWSGLSAYLSNHSKKYPEKDNLNQRIMNTSRIYGTRGYLKTAVLSSFVKIDSSKNEPTPYVILFEKDLLHDNASTIDTIDLSKFGINTIDLVDMYISQDGAEIALIVKEGDLNVRIGFDLLKDGWIIVSRSAVANQQRYFNPSASNLAVTAPASKHIVLSTVSSVDEVMSLASDLGLTFIYKDGNKYVFTKYINPAAGTIAPNQQWNPNFDFRQPFLNGPQPMWNPNYNFRNWPHCQQAAPVVRTIIIEVKEDKTQGSQDYWKDN